MKATTGASSLTIKGDVTDPEMGSITLDLAVDSKGECTGSLSIGDEGTADPVKTGEIFYMKYDEALLRQESEGEPAEEVDATVKLLAGRWMESKASDPDTKDMIEFCDLKGLLKSIEANDTAARKAGEEKVDGKPALRLTEKDGKETHTFHVAAEGDPYILRIASTGGEEPMTLNLSEFNQPVVAEKPAAKDIVDLGQ